MEARRPWRIGENAGQACDQLDDAPLKYTSVATSAAMTERLLVAESAQGLLTRFLSAAPVLLLRRIEAGARAVACEASASMRLRL